MKMDFVIVVVTVKTIAVDIGLVFGASVVVFCHSYFIHSQFIFLKKKVAALARTRERNKLDKMVNYLSEFANDFH